MHLDYALVHYNESNHNYLNKCKSKLFDVLDISFTLYHFQPDQSTCRQVVSFSLSLPLITSRPPLFSSVRSLLPLVGPWFVPRQSYPGL